MKKALADARLGEEILLAPGTYDDNFTASHSGTSGVPVTLCGPRSAVLNGGSVSRGYTFYLDHASWWRLNDLIEDNNIADTTAENIDIKEGIAGGQIIGNHPDHR